MSDNSPNRNNAARNADDEFLNQHEDTSGAGRECTQRDNAPLGTYNGYFEGASQDPNMLSEMAHSIKTLTQVVTELSKKAPEASGPGPSRTKLKKPFLDFQYELNTQWADGLARASDCFDSDPAEAKRMIDDTLEKIRKRNELLVAGDEHPEIFAEMSKLQKAEQLASVTGLPKGDLLKILKTPQDTKAKVPPKRPRVEPYARPPFPSAGSGSWPTYGSASVYNGRYSQEPRRYYTKTYDRRGSRENSSTDECYHCHQRGHWSNNCPMRRRKD